MSTWPASLRAMVANIIHSRQPMLLFWGPELIQFYNDAFVPSFGQGKHPAALGQPARECWADAWPVIGAQIDAVMSRGEPAWHENALVPIYRNGRMEEVFWTYSYSPAHDDSGAIVGTLVIVTETTERVLAARRLELLSRLGIALSGATTHSDVFDGLAELAGKAGSDLPFLIVRNGEAIVKYVGIDAASAERVASHLRADTSGTPVEIASEAAVLGTVWPEPVRWAVRGTLSQRDHDIVVGLSPRLPYDAGYRSFVEQFIEQIAATLRRIDTANASRAVQRQRDNLLMQAPLATALMIGPEHVYHLANPLYCKLVGRDPVGKTFRDAFPELRDTQYPQVFDRVYRTGESVRLDEQLVQLDRGGTREDAYVDFNLEPLRDESDRVYGLMAVAVDITDKIRARRALQDAIRAKDEFLAMLGHELRNPLAPIVTALELMSEKKTDLAQERAVIERQVRHVIRLVDDLLDVSRITRGLITLEHRVVDLADVVDAAVAANAHLIELRGHELVTDVTRGVIVNGDEARLVQIASNLLTNAARYTPPGGRLRVSLAKRDGKAILSVADNGIGMDADLLPNVFDIFVQGARGIDRSEGGLGLGLAIVKNLVTLHGGQVSAHSDGRGKGSEFTVELALVDAQAVSVMIRPPLAVAAEAKRLLVVDDNEDAANLLAEIARDHGHDVTVAHDPFDALAACGNFHPQVAVLDIGLPGMDGYELAARLREVCPDCRLIALTGYGQSKDRELAINAGFSDHLVKPVRIQQLLEALGR
jgi:signal transduction histidine kinase